MAKQHRYEELVEALVELVEAKIEALTEFLSTDGRPLFHEKVDDEMLLALWEHPLNRLRLQESVLAREGPEGLEKLNEHILRLQLRQPTITQAITGE